MLLPILFKSAFSDIIVWFTPTVKNYFTLASKLPKQYNTDIMLKFAKNPVFKKYFCVLVCLVIAGNVSQGVVLCFGHGAHVAIESAFHNDHGDHCGHASHTNTDHSDRKHPAFDRGHDHTTHCHPCVDVPIPADVAKLSNFTQYNYIISIIPAHAFRVTADADFTALNSAFDHSVDSPYRASLRTVVILC